MRISGGFSIIEVMVSIGVIAILLGLLLPSLGSTVSDARLTADLVRMRDASVMIGVYTSDHNDVYPFTEVSGMYGIGRYWLRPMLAGGYYDDVREIDNFSDERGTDPTVLMSAAMSYDWRKMTPGNTVPVLEQFASPVRTSAVVFPSLKGLVFRAMSSGPPESLTADVDSFCCTGARWEFPVANADGSAVSGDWLFFTGGRPLDLEDDVGIPVLSTWSGVRGVDR